MKRNTIIMIAFFMIFGLLLNADSRDVIDVQELTGLNPQRHLSSHDVQPLNQLDFTRDPDYQVYGYCAYDPSGTTPVGPVTFILNDPIGLTSLGADISFISAATMVEDIWIGCDYGTGNFYSLDFDGTLTFIGGNGTICHGIAYDDDTGILYGSTYNSTSACSDLYTIDIETGYGTYIGNINYGVIIAMACDNEGNLYGVDVADDNLWSIDPITGDGSIIGSLGISISWAQDAEYDKDDEVLYLSAYENVGELYSCDTATGATTYIGAFPGGLEVDGFAIPYALAEDDVPAAVSDLVIIPDAGGALSCELEWVNPDLTYGGDPLTELLETRVYRDGNLVHTNYSPGIGDPDSFTDTVPAVGLYNYKVTAYNSAGESLSDIVETWIGDPFSGVLIIDLDHTPTGSTLQTSIQNYYSGEVLVINSINEFYISQEVDAIFVLLGVWDQNTQILIGEETLIVDYINGGGNVYLEGGDVWFFDVWQGGFDFCPLFGISAIEDGYPDLSNINGHNFLDGMTWSYSGTNALIDRIAPIAPAVTIFSNLSPGYDCGVAYNSGTYKTVGTSFEITGLGGTNSLDDAVEGIGNFFGIFGPLPDPGYIEGTVTLIGGTGNVEDVEVTAGGETVNPDVNGDYVITISSGTYNVTAALADYEDDTVPGVVVEELITTTGIDFELLYDPSTWDPPINLNVTDNLFTWDAPATPTGFFEGFEGTFPPDGWLKLNPDGGTGWEPLELGTIPLPGWQGGEATACPDGGNWQAYVTYSTGGPSFNDQWLITPQITVADGDMLDFWMIYYNDFYIDHVEILISTTVQDDVNAFDTVVDIIEFQGGSSIDWTQYTYTLTDYVAAGTPVYIAFRESVANNTNEGSAISIDNILVGTPTDYGSVVSVPQPANVNRDMHYTHIPNTHVVSIRELESYDVYLDGDLQGNTDDEFWSFTDLTVGQEYEAGVVAVYDNGESEMATILFNAVTDANNNIINATTSLKGNYPNPFNPITKIVYSVKDAGKITLEVYNLKGQLVKTLVNETKETGDYIASWNGTDNTDNAVSSGIYFYKMKTGKYVSIKKMILMK